MTAPLVDPESAVAEAQPTGAVLGWVLGAAVLEAALFAWWWLR